MLVMYLQTINIGFLKILITKTDTELQHGGSGGCPGDLYRWQDPAPDGLSFSSQIVWASRPHVLLLLQQLHDVFLHQ